MSWWDDFKESYVGVGNDAVEAVQQVQNPVLDAIFEVATRLGEPVVLVPLAFVAPLFFRRQWWLCPSIIMAVLTVAVLNDELKETLRVERPDEATAVGDSTPSAHSMMAAAAWFQIAAVTRPDWRWLPIGIPIVVAFSRVYLEQHYPNDVLLGLLLGGVIAFVWYQIFHPPSAERPVRIAHALAGFVLGAVVIFDLIE